jgi:FtsZ-binding cell division protein ZapB
MERFEEIRERLNNATSGPWEYADCACEIWSTAHKTVTDDDVVIGGVNGEGIAISEDNYNFVCHAPDDIKYLLEQITALQEENEKFRRGCVGCRDHREDLYQEAHEELIKENAVLKSDLLDGSKTGYEAMRREITTLKDYNHALKVANDTTFENYKKLEQGSATLKKALELAKQERDAAVIDLRDNANRPCYICKSWENGRCTREIKDCAGFNWWSWRGIQQTRSAINSKEGEEE